jgi:hypothetical protein
MFLSNQLTNWPHHAELVEVSYVVVVGRISISVGLLAPFDGVFGRLDLAGLRVCHDAPEMFVCLFMVGRPQEPTSAPWPTRYKKINCHHEMKVVTLINQLNFEGKGSC